MKKQINPNVKAHLIRSAFYVLLLLAVCVIPFALAQRNSLKANRPTPAKPKAAATVDKAQIAAQLAARAKSVPATLVGKRQLAAQQKTASTQGQRRYDVRPFQPILHPGGFSNAQGTAPAILNKGSRVAPVLRRPAGVCPPVITESTTQAIVDLNSVSCNAGGITLQNSYWRAFNMNTFTGGQDYDITAVEFAIEQAVGGVGGSQPATVNLYANHGAAFPGGDWQSNLIASVPINIPDQADSIFNVPVVATAPGSALELVMEVNIPDGTAAGNSFFIGSNTDPETAPSYLSAADCGVPDPTPTGDIGFPNMHIVFNVNGSCAGGGATPTPTPGGNCGTYSFALGTATFVPGVDDLNLDCDDCSGNVALPFSVHLYDQDFTSVQVGSNGWATFGVFDDGFGITCSPFGIAGTTYALAPFWDDQTVFAADGHGVFTTTTGSAPNRIFYIEWRSFYFGEPDELNYEIAINENGGSPTFQYIYNTITPSTIPNPFSQLVIGTKQNDSNSAQFGCDPTGGQAPPVASGDALTLTCEAGPPASPTPTPSGTPGGCTFNGSIDTGDPTQIDRLFRSGIPQTCPPSTTCATFGDPTPRHYDEYSFTNTTGATQCVTVDTTTDCTGTNFVFVAAYLGTFDPTNICTNWIGDSGSSPDIGVPAPFSFNVDDGQTFVVVVSEVTPDAGCSAYTIAVSPQSICGGGGGSPTPSPTCIPGSPNGAAGPWTAGTAYPTTIVRYGFAQTSTHLYVFGGVDNGAITPAVNRMDLATGTWEPRAAMPFSSEGPTCALDEAAGLVYCAEGADGAGGGNQFASYNIATDSWTPLAPDPFVLDHFGSVSGVFNGKVFVIGGTQGFSNANWVYDIASNSWSLGTAAPTTPFEFPGYHQVGQFLYVVGGYDGSFNNVNTTLRLDMSSAPGVWETGPTFTPQLADFGLAYDPGTNTLYSLGGDLGNDGNPFNSTAQVNELDVSAWPGGTWNPSPPDLPAPPRQAAQAGFFGNGDIWAVGGINGATFQFLNEVWHRNNGGGVVCPSPTPTVTPPISPTPTATATATITPPPSATPTATASATATATTPPGSPTPSPTRPPPTPRPRPTPYPRPTPP